MPVLRIGSYDLLRRRLSTLLALALVAAAAATAATPAGAAGDHWYDAAKAGIKNAHRHWWNSGRGWYNETLTPYDSTPLASIWDIVPLFEAIDAQAIGNPTSANRSAVRTFADGAQRYWNPHVSPHGAWAPYPGDSSCCGRTYFDDNGWWGLAFIDAYRATKNKSYLDDAARALRFIDARGWDGSKGMWWNTDHPHHSLEAWASAAALAAELYQYTDKSTYRKLARKYVSWGNKHADESSRGLYATKKQPVSSYVEGAMIGAHLALCRKGDKGACKKAKQLAQACYEKWGGKSPNHAPQFDTILMRYVLQLGDYDRDPTWWEWAHRVAVTAEKKAKSGDLYLRFWDGSKATDHSDGAGRFHAGMVQTHSATVALFAWLAATKRPPGKARPVPHGVGERPKWQTWITVDRQDEHGDRVCYIQGHIAGYSSKSVKWHLKIELSAGGSTDSRERDGTGDAGEKTTGVVTILQRHVTADAPPLDVDVTGHVAGKTYRSHERLQAPWC